ncbi:FAD-binding domain [Bradyrhizobium manausense]|jgi:2-polyprenyl-6-methoxyphenol hydroxylase-like FAD-dependent oxidoreductase|uniref:FAD-binding domain n=1 Tax=Bradyrhizobium manausense TaxID=989370 RepID=UPI001BAE54CC|nr:FAD-binding domain [Bradyrhizobium manausense]MBR0792772.1 FAD-binding domain [Bradyrhizobium manausense]
MKTVLISGAGIAGPTLAYWLKRAGYVPTLVERAPALRRGGYVIDFWGLGYDIAERMGLLPAIDRAGYHVREVRIVDDDGRRAAGFGTQVFDELTGGRFITLARSDLSHLLYEKISASTEVIFDDEIVALEERADEVGVRFLRGGERRFDLVIGADGLHSQVRRLAFGPQQAVERHLGYGVAAFEVHGYDKRDENTYLMYTRPGRMIGRFALHGDRTLLVFIFADDANRSPATLADQKATLRDIYRDARWEWPQIGHALEHCDDLYFDRVSQIKMDCWSRGRIALIGDAAFCVSLVAGQGSALAMISAYVLAGELARADGRYRDAFGAYEARLRSYIDAKQRGAERFAAAFAPRTSYGLWFRNQVVRAFSWPGAARLAVGRDLADKLDVPDYRWGAPGEADI